MRFPGPAILLLALPIAVASAEMSAPMKIIFVRAEPPRESVMASAAEQPTAREFAAALLAATNRVREAHRLRSLRPRRELDRAADDHAAFMALTWSVQHSSPVRGQETPADRIRNHGLSLGRVAENVAARNVGQGDERASVEEIAERMVEQWMNSPGHRANLLSREFTHFGAAVRVVRVQMNSWRAFGVQLFYTPSRQFARM